MAEGITLKRIIDMDEAAELTSSDYALVDSATGGPKKFALGNELSSLKEDFNEINGKIGTYAVRQRITTLDSKWNRTYISFPIANVDDTFCVSIEDKSVSGHLTVRVCSADSPYASAALQVVTEIPDSQKSELVSFVIKESVKASAKYIVICNTSAGTLVPFTLTYFSGDSVIGFLNDEAVQYITPLDFCLKSIENMPNTRIKKTTGLIEPTTDNLVCSGKYQCNEGDKIQYKLSSDNAIFATYSEDGTLNTIVNGTSYDNYISGEYTFTASDKYFAISGSKSRYESGLYSVRYVSKFKRYESLFDNIGTHTTQISDLIGDVEELDERTSKLTIAETIKPNDVYYNGHLMRRCYNPYKNGGNLCLVGQLHCHTVGTASGETQYCTPEQLCQLHKENGYDFITITDYGHLETYGGYNAHPETVPENFVWLFDSQETAIPSGDGYAIKHVCMYNSREGLTFSEYMSLQEIINTYQPDGIICSLAHPMWASTYFSPSQIKSMVDKGLRFCELYDGLTHQNNQEQFPSGSDTDFAWQAMLDNGMFVFGIAISDLHGVSVTELKNGCVKVFCDEKNKFEILKNLCLGNFYSTTNSDVSLESVSVVDGLYSVSSGDASATTVFMKENGTVLSTVSGASASYQITGDEKYVRAKVTLSSGAKIWTQPVFNVVDELYNNYTEYMDF